MSDDDYDNGFIAGFDSGLASSAIKEIDRLRAENEKLRAALKVVCQGVISERGDIDCAVIESAALRAAAAAIRESGE